MYNSQWETKIKPILEDIGLLQVFSLRVKIYIYIYLLKKKIVIKSILEFRVPAR